VTRQINPSEKDERLPHLSGRKSALGPFGVLHHREFRHLWVGLTTSTSGTALRTLSASILIYRETGSAAWVGAVNFMAFLPIVFLSLPGGYVVDRRGSRTVLIWAQVLSIAASASLAAAAALHRATPILLCTIMAVIGCCYSFTKPAAQALLPTLVPDGELTDAIAVNGLQFTLGLVFGPLAASVVLTFFGFAVAFSIDTVSFVILLMVSTSLQDVVTNRTAGERPWKSIGEALRFVARQPVMPTLLVGIVCGTAAIEVVKTLMPVFAVRSFHVPTTAAGFLIAFFGLGTLVGVLLVSRLEARFGTAAVSVMALGVLGSSVVVFSRTRSVASAIPLLFVAGIGHMVGFSALTSMVFRIVPEPLRGRVLAVHALSFLGVSPFTALAAGFLAASAGVATAGTVMGGVGLIGAVVLGVRARRFAQTLGSPGASDLTN
jgi:MFS family permease